MQLAQQINGRCVEMKETYMYDASKDTIQTITILPHKISVP